MPQSGTIQSFTPQPLTEKKALKSAHLGTGQHRPGEVYYQKVGHGILRAVLIAGRECDGSVLGWYLPHPQEAETLGQHSAYLIPARFMRPEIELSIPDSFLSNELLRAIINRVFFPEKISGLLK